MAEGKYDKIQFTKKYFYCENVSFPKEKITKFKTQEKLSFYVSIYPFPLLLLLQRINIVFPDNQPC